MTEILDLRHMAPRQLRPLLEAEARLWEKTLRWDYRSSTELLLDYLNGRILPGFVAIDLAGVPQGFCFCVYEAQKAVIGDCFSLPAFSRAPGDEGRDPTLDLLLTHLVSLLRASPGVDRIESQLLLYPSGSLRPLFGNEGFQIFPRFFMERPLDPAVLLQPAATPSASAGPLPSDPAELSFAQTAVSQPDTREFRIRRWAAADFEPAAQLIHAAYQKHIDARINDQYRTLHGSLRFLHNIVRFPGCGVFEASHSWILEDRRSGDVAGMLLCSRVASDVAHITQLCVVPQLRGRGFGRDLLRCATRALTAAGYAAITLTVTAENADAVALYGRAGFTVRRRFDAAVLELGSRT